MTAMTDVPVPAGDAWTLAYTSGGTPTVFIHNRHGASDLLVRVNGSSGAPGDDLNSAAELLRPYDRMSIVLADGDKVFVKTISDRSGRATVRV